MQTRTGDLVIYLFIIIFFLFSEVNPLDYVYNSIDCQIELLDHNSEECQLILEYIHNSSEHISLFYCESTSCSEGKRPFPSV